MSIGYTNGGAPDSALGFIDGTHVSPDVYERVTALQAYAATVGRQVHVLRLGGYANLAEQRARQTGSNSASTVPVAEVGQSTHGVYHAADVEAHSNPGRVDLGNTLTTYTNEWLAWLVGVAPAFGLIREWPGPPVTSKIDPNHFMASGKLVGMDPPKPPVTPKEYDMTTLFQPLKANSSDGVLPAGFAFSQAAPGMPLYPVTMAEYSIYTYWATLADVSARRLVIEANWTPDSIRNLSKQVGVMAFSMLPDGTIRLANKLIFDDPKNPVPIYPTAGGVAAPIDVAALAVALAPHLAIPTAAEVAEEIAKRLGNG